MARRTSPMRVKQLAAFARERKLVWEDPNMARYQSRAKDVKPSPRQRAMLLNDRHDRLERMGDAHGVELLTSLVGPPVPLRTINKPRHQWCRNRSRKMRLSLLNPER